MLTKTLCHLSKMQLGFFNVLQPSISPSLANWCKLLLPSGPPDGVGETIAGIGDEALKKKSQFSFYGKWSTLHSPKYFGSTHSTSKVPNICSANLIVIWNFFYLNIFFTLSRVPNNSAARWLIFPNFSLPTWLIWTYTLIKFQGKILPTRLLCTYSVIKFSLLFFSWL